MCQGKVEIGISGRCYMKWAHYYADYLLILPLLNTVLKTYLGIQVFRGKGALTLMVQCVGCGGETNKKQCGTPTFGGSG